MNPTADEYRKWLAGFPKEPPDRMALALVAVAAYEHCVESPALTPADLQPLVDAAGSSHSLVFQTGAELLTRLAETSPEAQHCFRRMSQDKSATARFHAVAYLRTKLPEDLRLEIITRALADRCAKVRSKAVECAEQFRFKQLLPRLESLLQSETNAGVRATLEMHIPLLRDGYWLRPFDGSDGFQLSVSTEGSLITAFIPREKCTDEFVRREIVRLKQMRP